MYFIRQAFSHCCRIVLNYTVNSGFRKTWRMHPLAMQTYEPLGYLARHFPPVPEHFTEACVIKQEWPPEHVFRVSFLGILTLSLT